MKETKKQVIVVSVLINSPVEKVWDLWTGPQHILRWNSASDDWHTTRAENDLIVGGKFLARMEAKDGSAGFDFWGIYNSVLLHKFIGYTLGDGRNVSVIFASKGDMTEITESFEAEETNSLELQKSGWQAILDNFKKYTEKV
jgi:uncharacterized protein YndB with AHSA1/START domain